MVNSTARKMFKSPEESFAYRTERQGSCLIWTGATSDNGYGIIWAGKKLVRAHRYAWERVHGPIPDGMFVDHICHNRRCCNVEHLRLATTKQNNENRSGPQSNNLSSGVRGVTFHKGTSKWVAQVGHNRRNIYVGLYATIAEAEAAVTAKRNELFTHNLN